MKNREHELQQQILDIKQQLAALGDMRPGALSQQYNICGNPNCRCKASPPIKHGPYYQISFTRRGRSSSQFVRAEDVPEVQQQLENYRQLRELVDEWIGLSAELSILRIRQKRHLADAGKQAPKPRISKLHSNPRRNSRWASAIRTLANKGAHEFRDRN